MKKTSKKILGALMVFMLVGTIGAVIASAVDSDTEEETDEQKEFFPKGPMFGKGPFFDDLTDEQKEEIKAIIEDLRENDATWEEINTAIMEKLDEYGVLDERLDNQIEQTEQRLEVLNRQKELREQGKSWEEIKEIIQEEFDLELPGFEGKPMMHRHGFRHEPCMENNLDIITEEGSEI
jgi:Spy/CpxP family protein refolding chaperone